MVDHIVASCTQPAQRLKDTKRHNTDVDKIGSFWARMMQQPGFLNHFMMRQIQVSLGKIFLVSDLKIPFYKTLFDKTRLIVYYVK